MRTLVGSLLPVWLLTVALGAPAGPPWGADPVGE
jgi:hypothetical protein